MLVCCLAFLEYFSEFYNQTFSPSITWLSWSILCRDYLIAMVCTTWLFPDACLRCQSDNKQEECVGEFNSAGHVWNSFGATTECRADFERALFFLVGSVAHQSNWVTRRSGSPARQSKKLCRRSGSPARQSRKLCRRSGSPARQSRKLCRRSGSPAHQSKKVM